MKRILQFIFLIIGHLVFTNCSSGAEIVEPIPEDPDLSGNVVGIPSDNTVGVLLNEADSYKGYTLFASYKSTYLIDNCGRVINSWTSEYERGGAFHLLEDGSLLRSGKIDNPDLPYGGIGGIIEKYDWNGNLTWQYVHSTPSFSQHHGLYPMLNGNILILAAYKMDGVEALQAGRNPGNFSETLYDEKILEIAPLGNKDGTIVWEWSAWDHFIQNFDDTKDNYGVIADNPQLLNVNFLGVENVAADWLHFNSLDYNQDFDQILIGSQKLSEIYIIDHSTTTEEARGNTGGNSGMGGDFLYRWGNPRAYDHGTAEDQRFFGQHNARWIPGNFQNGGKILVFNNGLGRELSYSSVDIIDPEKRGIHNYVYKSGESFAPQHLEWTYQAPEDVTLFYSRILSSAQRLPNGNTLVCEGTTGVFFEINENGETVWRYVNPVTPQGKVLTQGDTPLSGNIFQVIRYGPDFVGFQGKDLTASNPIEMNFNIGDCN
ncbi:MAG: aryl-sulfate sulfotransferase [Flavobacteriaceae bacterium]